MPEPRYIDLLSQIQQDAATMPGSPASRGLPARVPGARRPRHIKTAPAKEAA